MTLDILVHIDSQSPEGRIVGDIVTRDHVTPEEAVLRLLKQLADQRSPADQIWGAFSSPEDAGRLYAAAETNSLRISSDEEQNRIQQLRRSKQRPNLGFASERGIWMSDDFDEPLEEFKDYM